MTFQKRQNHEDSTKQWLSGTEGQVMNTQSTEDF